MRAPEALRENSSMTIGKTADPDLHFE
jgi:hypothetical protein